MDGQSNWHHHPQHTSNPANPVSSDHNAQSLLAVYPMASPTPSAHVATHLSSLAITSSPPSFSEPDHFGLHAHQYPPANPPSYEYAHEVNYLASPHRPESDPAYWENARNDAVRILRDQAGPSYPQYPSQISWSQSSQLQSSYRTNTFAQSVFQRSAPPSSTYPTPPPPGITTSSSSLAFALGDPTRPQPARTTFKSEDSSTFFNDFVTQKSREIGVLSSQVRSRPTDSFVTSGIPKDPQFFSLQAPPTTPSRPSRNHTFDCPRTPPPRQYESPLQESPDPLALITSNANDSPSAVTPCKRKPMTGLQSPSIKRINSSYISASFSTPSNSPTVPLTPASSSTSFSGSRRLAYVEVPPIPKAWRTPSSIRKQRWVGDDDTPDDLGGYGSVDGDYSPSWDSRSEMMADVKSSARRTGDRDDRVPLEKLMALLEDIFEAEDALSPDVALGDLPTEFFSPLTADCAQPQLHPNIIRKLTKYIGHVARPTKRIRLSAGGRDWGTLSKKGRMAEVDIEVLGRLLKLLERSVRAGEDLDPFRITIKDRTASPRKQKKGKRLLKSEGAQESEATNGIEEKREDVIDEPLTNSDLELLERVLYIARDSILAADCCIALLGSDRLTKQLYSEELITTCLGTIKNQLAKIVYAFVEASGDIGNHTSPLLVHLIKNNMATSKDHRRQLSETFQALSAVLPRINTLLSTETVTMSDSIIIQTVYIAIGPFFVVDLSGGGDMKGKKDNVILSTLGKSAMRGLRLDALSLIRSIFANHEDQRSWIIEEILTSLIRLSDTKQKAGQFKLRDGHSIRTVSALLLQLVQTSAHDVRIEARGIDKARHQAFALRKQESVTGKEPKAFLDEYDMQEIRLYTSGLESATKAAKTIILFLTQRSGKGKATKNSNEAEYRTIFDNLISDLLAVLYWPEWPAASLLLSIACKYMVSSLDDVKTINQADNNAAKTIALDHLGVIAARIRFSVLKVKPNESVGGCRGLQPLDEIVSNVDSKALQKLLSIHQDVASHLCKRSSEDQAYDSARELTAAALGQELALALTQLNVRVSDEEQPNIKKVLAFGQRIKDALRDVWKDHSTDVFDVGSHEEVLRIDRLAEEIGTVQGLRCSFHPILNVILLALDAPPVFMRTKALRALGQIVTSDPTILSASSVRRAIEGHLLDSSAAVRDAAVELIGKYMLDSPEVAGDYYGKIADRIADTGLGVRKRVIKLLKSFYNVTNDTTRRIDISKRLILRMLDEDDTVKDLAVRTIEELWFQCAAPSSSYQKSKGAVTTGNLRDKGLLLMKVAVVMGTSAHFKDRQSPLEDMLHKIMADKGSIEANALHVCYAEICETLIDGLVDASDLPGFTVVNCVRTIYLFTSAYPAILSGANASTLLPYLKNATTVEEQATSDYLLKIFRTSIPHMPKTAATFGRELQSALQPMILKPSSTGGVLALQETVACMCVVVQCLTHDFGRLVALVKSCNTRLQQAIARPVTQTMKHQETKALSILIFIVALLGEHCDFDRLRVESDALASDLNMISEGSITEHIYNSLIKLYEKHDDSGLRGRILQCLGFLFRAQPTLMTLDSSATIMDAIFASAEEEGRGRLLKIMQEFLVSEASKYSAKEKENAKEIAKSNDINMEELVGNTDGFADSGVSSAIVQRYLCPILEAALSQQFQVQAAAIDILSFTVKQGLAHPLQSFPVIVALETSTNSILSSRANALHAVLHSKHTSLLNTRYVVSARLSFDYQKKLSLGPVRGYRLELVPTALLHRWYSLVREKRTSRQDFLKSLVKVFDVNIALKSSQDDVDFARYMSENFSSFDYKTQEEVFTVIKYLTSVLSTVGMQLVEALSPSHLLNQLRGPSQEALPLDLGDDATTGLGPESKSRAVIHSTESDHYAIMRSSVVVGMIMLLKYHLKVLYGLSEEKCSKFSVGKKSAIGDRPATKHHDKPISWDRLPYAKAPLLTAQDLDIQKSRFLDIWNEDGLSAEPQDELE